MAVTTISQLTPSEWEPFVKAYRQDRIPFLGCLIAHAASYIDTEGATILTWDEARGRVGLYAAPIARSVACCVNGLFEEGDLREGISREGIRNNSVCVTSLLALPFEDGSFSVALGLARIPAFPHPNVIRR